MNELNMFVEISLACVLLLNGDGKCASSGIDLNPLAHETRNSSVVYSSTETIDTKAYRAMWSDASVQTNATYFVNSTWFIQQAYEAAQAANETYVLCLITLTLIRFYRLMASKP